MRVPQTYQGYIQDGRFIPINDSLAKIPEKRISLLQVFTDEVVVDNSNAIAKRVKALDDFYSGLAAIDDEPFDEEFDAIVNKGIKLL